MLQFFGVCSVYGGYHYFITYLHYAVYLGIQLYALVLQLTYTVFSGSPIYYKQKHLMALVAYYSVINSCKAHPAAIVPT